MIARHDQEEVEMNRVNAFKAAVVGTLAVGVLAASAAPAQAQTGDRLNFNGSANLSDVPGSGGSQLFIDFLVGGATTGAGGTVSAVETINGVFDPEIVPGTVGNITDLVVDASSVVGTPVDPFVSIGGYTFTLDEAPDGNVFGPISLIGTPTGTSGFFGVMGTVTGGDFGTTPWSYQGLFTAQFSGKTPEQVFNAVNSGGTLPVSFSAEFVIGTPSSVVPEPSTYLLLGTGIAGLGLIGFRRRRQTQA
jgi:hypothetical protein